MGWREEQAKIKKKIAERDSGYTIRKKSGEVIKVSGSGSRTSSRSSGGSRTSTSTKTTTTTTTTSQPRLKTTSEGITYIEKDGKKYGITQEAYAAGGAADVIKAAETREASRSGVIISPSATIYASPTRREPISVIADKDTISVGAPSVMTRAGIMSDIVAPGEKVILTSDTGAAQVLDRAGGVKRISEEEAKAAIKADRESKGIFDEAEIKEQVRRDMIKEKYDPFGLGIFEGENLGMLKKEDLERIKAERAAEAGIVTESRVEPEILLAGPGVSSIPELQYNKDTKTYFVEYEGTKYRVSKSDYEKGKLPPSVVNELEKKGMKTKIVDRRKVLDVGTIKEAPREEVVTTAVTGVPAEAGITDAQKKEYEKKISSLNKQIADEKAKGASADLTKVSKLENELYNVKGEFAQAAFGYTGWGTATGEDYFTLKAPVFTPAPRSTEQVISEVKGVSEDVKKEGTFQFGDMLSLIGGGIEKIGEGAQYVGGKITGAGEYILQSPVLTGITMSAAGPTSPITILEAGEDIEKFGEKTKQTGELTKKFAKDKDMGEIVEMTMPEGKVKDFYKWYAGGYDEATALMISAPVQTQGKKKVVALVETEAERLEAAQKAANKEAEKIKTEKIDPYNEAARKSNEILTDLELTEDSEFVKDYNTLSTIQKKGQDELYKLADKYNLTELQETATENYDKYLENLETYNENPTQENVDKLNASIQTFNTSRDTFQNQLNLANEKDNFSYKLGYQKEVEAQLEDKTYELNLKIDTAKERGIDELQEYIEKNKEEATVEAPKQLKDIYDESVKREEDYAELLKVARKEQKEITELDPIERKLKEADVALKEATDYALEEKFDYGLEGAKSKAAFNLALLNKIGMTVADIGIDTADVLVYGPQREAGFKLQEGDKLGAVLSIAPYTSTAEQFGIIDTAKGAKGLTFGERFGKKQINAIIGTTALVTAGAGAVAPSATASALSWQAFGKLPSALAFMKGAAIVTAAPKAARAAEYVLSDEEERRVMKDEDFTDYVKLGIQAESQAIQQREGFLGGLSAFASEGPGLRLIPGIGQGDAFTEAVYKAAKAEGKSDREADAIVRAAWGQRSAGYAGEGIGFIGLSALTEMGGRATQKAVLAKAGPAVGFKQGFLRGATSIGGWGFLEGSMTELGTEVARYEEISPGKIAFVGGLGAVSAGGIGGLMTGFKGMAASAGPGLGGTGKKIVGEGGSKFLQIGTYLTDLGEYLGDKTADVLEVVTGKAVLPGTTSVSTSSIVGSAVLSDTVASSSTVLDLGGKPVGGIFVGQPSLTEADIYADVGSAAPAEYTPTELITSKTGVLAEVQPISQDTRVKRGKVSTKVVAPGAQTQTFDFTTEKKWFRAPQAVLGTPTSTVVPSATTTRTQVPATTTVQTEVETLSFADVPVSEEGGAGRFTAVFTEVPTTVDTRNVIMSDVPTFVNTNLYTYVPSFINTNTGVFTNTMTNVPTNIPTNIDTNVPIGVPTRFPRGGFSGLPFGSGLGLGAGLSGYGWGVQNPIAQWAEEYRQRLSEKKITTGTTTDVNKKLASLIGRGGRGTI